MVTATLDYAALRAVPVVVEALDPDLRIPLSLPLLDLVPQALLH